MAALTLGVVAWGDHRYDLVVASTMGLTSLSLLHVVAALEVLAREGIAFTDAATMLGLSPGEIAAYGPPATGVADGAPGQPTAVNPLELAGPLSSWLAATALLG